MHCCSFMKGLEALAGRAYTRLITAASSQCLLSRARNIPLLHFGYTFRNFRIIIIPCNFLKLLLSSINCISLIRRTKEISIFESRVGNVERCESDDYSIRLSNIVSRIFIYNYRRIREDDVSLLKLKYPMALVEWNSISVFDSPPRVYACAQTARFIDVVPPILP